MRVLVIGAGGVGSALVSIAATRDFASSIVVADLDIDRARRTADMTGDPRITAVRADASDRSQLVELITSTKADIVVNACDPRCNPPIFDAAFLAGVHYLDMAMHVSEPHPERPFSEVGVLLGQRQLDDGPKWEERGQLALVAMGVEPGLSDVFARYAADHLFSRVDEIGVRDGSDIEVSGHHFAPTFSIWTTIEECLNPPIVYERERGWYTTEPFSGSEVFDFPAGIGELRCVNVEHEEVVLMPRWLDVGKVTFKYGLGDEFIDVLQTLNKLGLDSTRPVRVRGVEVSPRDVVAALLPDPAKLGEHMDGRTCAGTLVRGLGVDGRPREVYLHHVVDNAWSMRTSGHQAVVWQTAVNPVVALEALATGAWHGTGVLGPEAFPSDPYLDLLNDHGVPWAIDERRPRFADVPRTRFSERSAPVHQAAVAG
jgi:saccharopine dehydrogenase (NAD+, L-lysine forming)